MSLRERNNETCERDDIKFLDDIATLVGKLGNFRTVGESFSGLHLFFLKSDHAHILICSGQGNVLAAGLLLFGVNVHPA